jgi:hypothetical protein
MDGFVTRTLPGDSHGGQRSRGLDRSGPSEGGDHDFSTVWAEIREAEFGTYAYVCPSCMETSTRLTPRGSSSGTVWLS